MDRAFRRRGGLLWLAWIEIRPPPDILGPIHGEALATWCSRTPCGDSPAGAQSGITPSFGAPTRSVRSVHTMAAPPQTSRLNDPGRLHGAALDPLREVGLNQLTIHATLAGGLDAQALGVLAADLALGGTLVVLTPWLAPVVVLAVSALVAITAVAVAPRNYGATLRSLLQDAETLLTTQPASADGALRWLIVEDLNDTLEANARILRFKGYLVTGAITLLLLSVLLILTHNL